MYAQTYASTVVVEYGRAYSNVDRFVTLALAVSPRIIHTHKHTHTAPVH